MATTYYLPEQYGGKSLNQLTKELGSGNPEVLGQYLGVDRNTKLSAGQQFTFNTPNGINPSGSGEYQFLNQYFTPYDIYQKQQSDAFSAKQKADEDAFMSALNAKVGGQESLTDASGRIGGELGLPGLRQSAQNLVSTLKNIPQTQETISKQVGISAPNLQKRIASEQGKIAPRAQEAVTQQQNAESELGQRLGYLVADQAKELEPFYRAQLPLLQDRLAREQTNYSQDKQNELTMILEKLNQGFQATQNELTRANQLATAELGYKNSLEAIKFSTDESIREAKALKELRGTGTDFDPNNSPYKIQNNNASYTPPQMSAPVGTIQESPAGSGIYWTSTGGGWE